MCELLSLFLVVGAQQVQPNTMHVELLNNGQIEQYLVPKKQYDKCMSSEYFDRNLWSLVPVTQAAIYPRWGVSRAALDAQSNGCDWAWG